MTYDSLSTFLTALNTAYVNYIDSYNLKKKISGGALFYTEIKMLYLRQYVYMINEYFSVEPIVDDNFGISTDIVYMLSACNEIMGTSLYMGFELDSYTAQDNFWDSIDRWYYYVQEV